MTSKQIQRVDYFKYDPKTQGDDTFNIEQALNENWDKTADELQSLGVEVDDVRKSISQVDTTTPVSQHNSDTDAHSQKFNSKADRTTPTISGHINMSHGVSSSDVPILKYEGEKILSVGQQGSGSELRVNNEPVSLSNHNHDGKYALATVPNYTDNPNSYREFRAYATTSTSENAKLDGGDSWGTFLNVPGFRPFQIGYAWNGSLDLFYRTSASSTWASTSKGWTRLINEDYLKKYGIVGECKSPSSMNLNSCTTVGTWFVWNTSNKPDGFTHGFLEVDYYAGGGFSPDGNGVMPIYRQRVTSYNTGEEWVRMCVRGTWSSWKNTSGGGGMDISAYKEVKNISVTSSTAKGTVLVSSTTGLDILSFSSTLTNSGFRFYIENNGKTYYCDRGSNSLPSDLSTAIKIVRIYDEGGISMPIKFTGSTVIKFYASYSNESITVGIK